MIVQLSAIKTFLAQPEFFLSLRGALAINAPNLTRQMRRDRALEPEEFAGERSIDGYVFFAEMPLT